MTFALYIRSYRNIQLVMETERDMQINWDCLRQDISLQEEGVLDTNQSQLIWLQSH